MNHSRFNGFKRQFYTWAAPVRLWLKDKYRRLLSALLWLTVIGAVAAGILFLVSAFLLIALVCAIDGLDRLICKAGGR